MIQHQNDNKVQNRWQTKAAILQQECLYQLYPKINLQMFKMITKKINMVIPDCLLAKMHSKTVTLHVNVQLAHTCIVRGVGIKHIKQEKDEKKIKKT